MRHRIKTFRFTCDSWYYKGGNKWEPTDCPNTLLLTGTEEEINTYFEQSGWTYQHDELDRHVCPRKHTIDSLGVTTPIEAKRIGLKDGIPIYETQE